MGQASVADCPRWYLTSPTWNSLWRPLHLPEQGARGLAQQVAQEAEAAPVGHAHLHTLHPMLSTPLHQRNHARHQCFQPLQTKALQCPQNRGSTSCHQLHAIRAQQFQECFTCGRLCSPRTLHPGWLLFATLLCIQWPANAEQVLRFTCQPFTTRRMHSAS